MRYSQLFGKTSSTAPSDADCMNAKLLAQGGFIHQQLAGVYIFLPLGLRVLTKLQNIIREEMNAISANEVLMPVLTQIENYKATGRDGLDILFHLEGPNNAEYVLNQSHEEVVTPLVKSYAFSYRDLPQAVYQIQNKFRKEPRAKSGILRGREFNMKDLYSFHADEGDLNAYYETVKAAYFRIYKRIGLGDVVWLTFASGGSFSRYSHEFQALCDVGEDTIYLCESCRVAVNREIIEEQKACPECKKENLTPKRAIEVGNIFKLRTRFSTAFDFTYVDASGAHQPVEMGCYGIGPSRIMGTLVELFHDSKGIIWPDSVAPFSIHIVGLGKDEAVFKEAQSLHEELTARGVEVLLDDRDESAGKKLNDADLIGIPLRVVVSARTMKEKKIELKRRCEENGKPISRRELFATMGL